MPLAVLAQHKGIQTRLVSVKGVVFDVSADTEFNVDGALAHLPGHEASRFFALATPESIQTTGATACLDAGLEGLKFDDHKRLESYFSQMVEGRRAVGVLADEDHERIFGTPFGGKRPRDDGHTKQTSAAADELHTLVEQGDHEAVRQLLRAGDPGETPSASASTAGPSSTLVDAVCSRTGMTPLLKAVEVASEETVRVLLEAGADVRSQAALYDGDDATSLARRLGKRQAIIDMLTPYYTTN